MELYAALFSIPFSVVIFLGVRWTWFRYRDTSYSRIVLISDAWLISASASVFPFFAQIVPLLEQLCLTAAQQSALKPFTILIALWVALGAAGLLWGNKDSSKVSVSVVVFALLVGAAYRVVAGNDPCQREAANTVVKAPDIDFLMIASWVLVAVPFAASVLYIWDFVARKLRERRARSGSVE